MPTTQDSDITALMLAAVAQRRPEVARTLARSARSPRQVAEILKALDEQERGDGCEFSRAFPALARAAVAKAKDDEDPAVEAFLARMRRLDEELVAEERALRHALRGR